MDREQKTILTVVASIVLILTVVAVVLFLNKDNIKRRAPFVAPPFEQTAISGMPQDIDESLTYKEVAIKEDYIIHLCATPKEQNGVLTLYFTSSDKNADLLKIRVFDSDNNLLGESGLIEPNSYIKDITLNRSLEDKEGVAIKVMSYQKESYYSNGSFKLNLFVTKDCVSEDNDMVNTEG